MAKLMDLLVGWLAILQQGTEALLQRACEKGDALAGSTF